MILRRSSVVSSIMQVVSFSTIHSIWNWMRKALRSKLPWSSVATWWFCFSIRTFWRSKMWPPTWQLHLGQGPCLWTHCFIPSYKPWQNQQYLRMLLWRRATVRSLNVSWTLASMTLSFGTIQKGVCWRKMEQVRDTCLTAIHVWLWLLWLGYICALSESQLENYICHPSVQRYPHQNAA